MAHIVVGSLTGRGRWAAKRASGFPAQPPAGSSSPPIVGHHNFSPRPANARNAPAAGNWVRLARQRTSLPAAPPLPPRRVVCPVVRGTCLARTMTRPPSARSRHGLYLPDLDLASLTRPNAEDAS